MILRKLVAGQVILGCLFIVLPVVGRPDSSPPRTTSPTWEKKKNLTPMTLHFAESQRAGDNAADGLVISDLHAERKPVVEYATKDTLVELITSVLGKKSCIGELNLYGHGNAGFISTGNGQSPNRIRSTFIAYKGFPNNDWERALSKLKGRFCEGATINLIGCKIGAGPQGAQLLWDLAVYFGVRVRAPAKLLYTGVDYKGPWQVALPTMSAPPTPIN